MQKYVVLSLVLALFVAACGQGPATPAAVAPTQVIPTLPRTLTPFVPLEPTPTVIPTIAVTNTPTPTPTLPPPLLGPDNFPADMDPLTGLVVTDTKTLKRRPIAIKVNITDRYSNRPPWGLAAADLVFEFYHNGGVSRYHAIYYGQDADLVGPIRSARMLDNLLVPAYKSVFAFGHVTYELRSLFDLSAYAARLVEEGGTKICPPSASAPLCRFDPSGPDLLLGGTKEISQLMTDRGVENGRQDLNGMTFHAIVPQGGKTGAQLFVRYSFVDYRRWDYDPQSGRYMLFVDKVNDTGGGEEYEPLIDRQSEKQIGADNVVVLVVNDEYAQRPPNEIVDIKLLGTGPAYVFRDGKVYQMSWNRPTNDSIVTLTDANGKSFPLKPGKTWFEITNPIGEITQQTDGAWRFKYTILP